MDSIPAIVNHKVCFISQSTKAHFTPYFDEIERTLHPDGLPIRFI